MSDYINQKWVDHLMGLAELEDNAGKKVAFITSAEKIIELEQALKNIPKPPEIFPGTQASLDALTIIRGDSDE